MKTWIKNAVIPSLEEELQEDYLSMRQLLAQQEILEQPMLSKVESSLEGER